MKRKIIYAFAAVVLTATVTKTQAQSWSLNGNAGTTTTNYLGTSDNKDLKIRTNNVVRMTVKSAGKVGIGTTSPVAKFDVFGPTGTSDTLFVIRGLVKKTGNYDVVGVYGESQPAAGYGIGTQGNGNFAGAWGNGGNFGVVGISGGVGVDGEATEAGATIDLTGVQGLTSGGDFSVGVYGEAAGATTNIGLYGYSPDTAGTSPDYAVVCVGDLYFWRAFAPSDAKLKSNIQPYIGALDKISQLKASTYVFNKAKYPGLALPSGNQTGFIAEEIQKVFPDLIKESSIPAGASRDARGKVDYKSIDNVKAVNYIGLIPVLAEAIKEQKQIVDQKDAVIAQQNERISKLENQIAAIQNALAAQKVSVNEQSAYLMQNTPNPSNGTTTVKFFLPENSKGVLELTDATGKIVKSYKVAGSGLSQVEINTTSFAVGSYTYSLLIDGKVSDSKNMVITK